MQKVIVKTAVKTLIVILSLGAILFGAFTMFAPQRVEKISSDMGNYNTAASFAAISYNRTKKITVLSDIVEYSVLAKNNNRIIKYGQILLTHSAFDELCKQKDESSNALFLASYRHYINGNYACALYKTGKVDAAFSVGKAATKEDADGQYYTENNAFVYLIDAAARARDAEFAKDILNYLDMLVVEFEELQDNEQEQLLAQAILRIDIDRQFLKTVFNFE